MNGAFGTVLIGQSYFLRFDPKQWEGGRAYPPLGSLQAAACVRGAGFDVEFFDAMVAESVDQWRECLEQTQPTVAVLFEDNFNYLSKMCLLAMREAALRMISDAKAVGATVLVCGSDATDRASQYLEQGADAILIGEGEETLLEVVQQLREDSSVQLAEVAGLAVFKEGAVVRSPPRSVMRDLDSLPSPAWDLVDMATYREIWQRHHGYFSLNVASTRGCPYHCNWCAKPIWGQTYNMRSAEAVADEIAHLAATYAPDHLWFADDILGLKKGWLKQFAGALEERGVRVPFDCQSRVDVLLRAGEIEALAAAGCRTVWVGAESGSQKILDAMDKGTTVEQIERATQLLREHGVGVAFFLQFGYPGEELEDVRATAEMVRRCAPDEIGMSVSYALPGTGFYESVREQLGSKQNWLHSDDLDMMHRGTYGTAFYRQLYQVIHKEHRLRRTLRRLRTLRLHRLSPREVVAAAYHLVTLPWSRWQLRRRTVPNPDRLAEVPPRLGHAAAATPSPQVKS